jgi:hypothetical protein
MIRRLRDYIPKEYLKNLDENGFNCSDLIGRSFYLPEDSDKRYVIFRQLPVKRPTLVVDFLGGVGASHIFVSGHLNDIEIPTPMIWASDLERAVKGIPCFAM